MTKSEFLEKLRAALGNDLTGAIIQENVNYYDQYIRDEVGRGRSETEVIDELGDPWVLAQTIIDTAAGGKQQSASTYDAQQGNYDGDGNRTGTGRRVHSVSGWKVVLVILGIIGILAVIVTVVGGVISFLAPVLVPVLIIAIIVRGLSKKR